MVQRSGEGTNSSGTGALSLHHVRRTANQRNVEASNYSRCMWGLCKEHGSQEDRETRYLHDEEMTDYEKGYRDGLVFVVKRICDRALEVKWYKGWYKMLNYILDDIGDELQRVKK